MLSVEHLLIVTGTLNLFQCFSFLLLLHLRILYWQSKMNIDKVRYWFLNVWLVLCLIQSHMPKDSGCLSSKECRFTIIKLRTVEARRFAGRMHFIVWKMSSVKVKKSSEQNRNVINTFLKGCQQCWLWSCVFGRSHSLLRIWY